MKGVNFLLFNSLMSTRHDDERHYGMLSATFMDFVTLRITDYELKALCS